MALHIEIPSKIEKALVAEANRRGISPSAIVLEALRRELTPQTSLKTPREMVAEWRQESVLGTFADRADSPKLARELRKAAELR